MDGKQLHLIGKAGYSWRAVRLRNLEADDVDDAAVSTSKEAGDMPPVGFHRLLMRGYLMRAIVSVSPPVGEREADEARKTAVESMKAEAELALKDAPAPDRAAALAKWTVKIAEAGDAAWAVAAEKALQSLPGTQWMPVSGLELMLKGGPKSIGKLFTPKDLEILRAHLANQYTAREDEASLIMGKTRPISMD